MAFHDRISAPDFLEGCPRDCFVAVLPWFEVQLNAALRIGHFGKTRRWWVSAFLLAWRKGEKSVKITTKHRFSLIALLPLILFAIPRSASAQSDGQKLFDTNCAKCHGPDGSGSTAIGKAVGAKDLRSAEAKKLTDAEIFTQIDQGKGNMPPFGGTLNKAQINSLIPIIRKFSKKATAPSEKAAVPNKKAGCCSRPGDK